MEEEDNTIIRKAETKTLARHLLYLSEVNVGMALFDEELFPSGEGVLRRKHEGS